MHKDIVKIQFQIYFHYCVTYCQHVTESLKMATYLIVDMYLACVVDGCFCVRSLCLLLNK